MKSMEEEMSRTIPIVDAEIQSDKEEEPCQLKNTLSINRT